MIINPTFNSNILLLILILNIILHFTFEVWKRKSHDLWVLLQSNRNYYKFIFSSLQIYYYKQFFSFWSVIFTETPTTIHGELNLMAGG